MNTRLALPLASAHLSRLERFALRAGQLVNHSPRIKWLAQRFSVAVHYPLIRLLAAPRIHLLGLEHLAALEPGQSVLLAANHRSFFDFYVIMTYYWKHARGCQRFYFPVRSGFWYDSFLGVVVNAVASSFSMFPPIFRSPEKAPVTRLGLDFLATELGRAGTVVGIHPEGTRSKQADPYSLLAPEQSFGRVVLSARPSVLPVFINGIGNSLLTETRASLRKSSPIFVVFGAPVELAEFQSADPHRLRTQIAVGKKVLDAISALGAVEKASRSLLDQSRSHKTAVVRQTDVDR